MRAKQIFEFEKTGNVKSGLGLGNYQKVKEKLQKMYDSGNSYSTVLSYKLLDLNHIEVFYKPEFVIDQKQARESRDLSNIKWILKYFELPKYVLNEKDETNTFYNTPIRTHTLSVYETIINFSEFPKKDVVDYSWVLDVGNYNKKGVKEMGEIIINALHENYEKVWGFELVNYIK